MISMEQREQANRIMESAERKHWVTIVLAMPYSQIFILKIWIDIFQNSEDVGQFSKWIKNLYSSKLLDVTQKSCEMIADDLYLHIAGRYPDRAVWIDVSEDGGNGVMIKYEFAQPSFRVEI